MGKVLELRHACDPFTPEMPDDVDVWVIECDDCGARWRVARGGTFDEAKKIRDCSRSWVRRRLREIKFSSEAKTP